MVRPLYSRGVITQVLCREYAGLCPAVVISICWDAQCIPDPDCSACMTVYCLLRLQQDLQEVVMVSGFIGYQCSSPRVLLSAVCQLSEFMEHHILSESSFSSQQGPAALLQLEVAVDEQSDWLQPSLCQPMSGKT